MLKTLMKTMISVSFCFAAIVPASAAPMMLQKPAVERAGSSNLVIQVESGKHGKMYRNNRNNRRGFYRHNNRGYYNGHRGYRQQRRGYRRHNGYWFPPAAFALGAIVGGALNNSSPATRPGYTNPQHVRWCYNKYRSYRDYDNSFQPYHGPRRVCRSPYY
tara:strand:- start:482 stop:961 length:480 start_codon:yes stop_codon:yes gene_type:complete